MAHRKWPLSSVSKALAMAAGLTAPDPFSAPSLLVLKDSTVPNAGPPDREENRAMGRGRQQVRRETAAWGSSSKEFWLFSLEVENKNHSIRQSSFWDPPRTFPLHYALLEPAQNSPTSLPTSHRFGTAESAGQTA